jgi:sterol desaturase/sphingolipid hydroxylase (fatty acid hydroxylase superfamily)
MELDRDVTETEFQILRGAGFVIAVALVVALQRLSPHARLKGSWRLNTSFWALNLMVMGTVCGACACTVARWAEANGIGFFNIAPFAEWLRLPVTLLALDLVSYGWHRANHVIPFLWRFHRVHHSDANFTASTAVRFHPGELVMSLPLRLSAVAALGASPLDVVIFEVIFTIANFIEHGDINLPRTFERRLALICITPALHRRHHSEKMAELQTNFGTIFSFWDRLLGTYGDSSSAERFRAGVFGLRTPATALEALILPARPVS